MSTWSAVSSKRKHELDFPMNSDRLQKFFRVLSEGHTKLSEHFLKFSEGSRRLPKISEEVPKIFRSNISAQFYFQKSYYYFLFNYYFIINYYFIFQLTIILCFIYLISCFNTVDMVPSTLDIVHSTLDPRQKPRLAFSHTRLRPCGDSVDLILTASG